MRWVPFAERRRLLTFETERALVATARRPPPAGADAGRPSRAVARPAAASSTARPALVDGTSALGARLIEFGGWLMPVQYAGILEEHRAVRERAGLFDLSHMGELFVEGAEAGEALAAALVSDPPARWRSAAPSTR